MFSSLIKAAIGVVVTPVALAVDIVSIPETAYEDKDAFSNTTKVLGDIGKNITNVLE